MDPRLPECLGCLDEDFGNARRTLGDGDRAGAPLRMTRADGRLLVDTGVASYEFVADKLLPDRAWLGSGNDRIPILAGSGDVRHWKLKENCDHAPKVGKWQVSDVFPIQLDASGFRVIQPAHQLGQCRLTRTISSHERDDLAPRKRKVKVRKHCPVASGVPESHLLKAQAISQRRWL